jgi:hypothetical protein
MRLEHSYAALVDCQGDAQKTLPPSAVRHPTQKDGQIRHMQWSTDKQGKAGHSGERIWLIGALLTSCLSLSLLRQSRGSQKKKLAKHKSPEHIDPLHRSPMVHEVLGLASRKHVRRERRLSGDARFW